MGLLLAALGAFTREASAESGYALGGDLFFEAGVGAAFAFNDNALLGRRGQFLDSPDSRRERESDLATRQSADLELTRRLGPLDSLSLASRFDLHLLHTVRELRGYDLTSSAKLAKSLGFWASVTPELELSLHREAPEWSYRTLSPAVRGSFTFEPGVIVDGEYRYSAQAFARTESGAAQLKNSYANIDNTSHSASLELKLWPTDRVRPSIAYAIQFSRFDDNPTANLRDYSGLPPGTERSDVMGSVETRVLLRPLQGLFVTPGARLEVNQSNSDPFRFVAIHGLLDAMWKPFAAHALFFRADLSRVDFPDEQFDHRFTNTRRDYRGDFALGYRLQAGELTTIQLLMRRLQSDSIDCERFDPRRDELGLPVYSRSYSCFTQNRVELGIRHSFEGS